MTSQAHTKWKSQEFYRACAKIMEPGILVRARVKNIEFAQK